MPQKHPTYELNKCDYIFEVTKRSRPVFGQDKVTGGYNILPHHGTKSQHTNRHLRWKMSGSNYRKWSVACK